MNPLIPIIVVVIQTYAPTTNEQEIARYESIARDLAAVTSSEKSLYADDDTRIKTMSVMLSIMSYESGFASYVDNGTGKYARGDGGNSWCLAQINVPNGVRVVVGDDGSFSYSYDGKTGWTGKDLVQDRTKCFKTELAILRASFACETTDEYARLNLYASGRCDWGYRESKHRMVRARRIEKMLSTPDEY